jgi:hypothetical protein
MRLPTPSGKWSGPATMLGEFVAAPTRRDETLIYALDHSRPRYALASDRAASSAGDRKTVLHAFGKRMAVYRNLP